MHDALVPSKNERLSDREKWEELQKDTVLKAALEYIQRLIDQGAFPGGPGGWLETEVTRGLINLRTKVISGPAPRDPSGLEKAKANELLSIEEKWAKLRGDQALKAALEHIQMLIDQSAFPGGIGGWLETEIRQGLINLQSGIAEKPRVIAHHSMPSAWSDSAGGEE